MRTFRPRQWRLVNVYEPCQAPIHDECEGPTDVHPRAAVLPPIMRPRRLLCAVAFALSGCSGDADEGGCVPNEQDVDGAEFRVCDADGEWGPWQASGWAACALPPGTYVFSYTQRTSANPCPDVVDELATLGADGTTISLAPVADCEQGDPVYDVARCQMTIGTTCDTQIGGGRSLEQSSVTTIDTRRMTAIFSTRATGYDNGATAYSCQGTYDVAITRL